MTMTDADRAQIDAALEGFERIQAEIERDGREARRRANAACFGAAWGFAWGAYGLHTTLRSLDAGALPLGAWFSFACFASTMIILARRSW